MPDNLSRAALIRTAAEAFAGEWGDGLGIMDADDLRALAAVVDAVLADIAADMEVDAAWHIDVAAPWATYEQSAEIHRQRGTGLKEWADRLRALIEEGQR